jgi:hypothetical protein
MSESARYRTCAAVCVELADENPDKRTQLLQIAEGLLSLASAPANAKPPRRAADASHAMLH